MGPQKLMVNLEIKLSVSPKLPKVFGVRELSKLLQSPESDKMLRWQNTEASLVEGFNLV